MTMIKSKYCRRCGEEERPVKKGQPQYLRSYCRKCESKINGEHNQAQRNIRRYEKKIWKL